MRKHIYSNLNYDDVVLDTMNVHSFENGEYLVEVSYNDFTAYVFDENRKILKFHSIEEVKNAFNECRVKRAFLVHQSAYDEMCGQEVDGDNTAKIKITLQ
ncbi:DUF6482 family protein [Flocculibacter collagenilyticus]|uniref:DUF6482 family protein n=1 Tax=Flocculibacter collagenilyticus TaxID=2744479 RepID=UPI0018F552AF|nr:DUF6482 family protein [Flocculibacter collagenilyticus]